MGEMAEGKLEEKPVKTYLNYVMRVLNLIKKEIHSNIYIL